MSKKQWGEMTKTIRSLSERKIGVSLREVADALQRPLNVCSGLVTRMVRAGELTKGGIHGEFRYFKSAEDAAAHSQEAEKDLIARKEAYRKRQNAAKAAKGRAKRAEARAAKGLPPYDPNQRKEKPVKAKKLDIEPRYSGIVLRTADQMLDNKKAHKQATIVWPENVKVHVLPRGEDTRFKFIPDPGWVGQFTQEWKEKRKAA